jgi:4,5-dihydroxyphthalate decarboxylase
MTDAKKKSGPLVLATGYHVRARPLWDGRVDGAELKLQVVPFAHDGERHRRFLAGDFDASELSLALYLALKSSGAPLTAIPVFPNRRFRYSFIYVRANSEIREPEDLRGKAIGVPSYLNTCGLWVRALLNEEYGLKTSDMIWKVQRKEAVPFTPPAGAVIEKFSGKRDLVARLLDGEVEALVTPDVIEDERVRRLFSGTKALEQAYYRKSGVFPVNHAIVIRNERLKRDRALPRKLFKLWEVARRLAAEDDTDPTFSNFVWIRDLWEEERDVFGGDPWRYGFRANERVIDVLLRNGTEQGIARPGITARDLFVPIE